MSQFKTPQKVCSTIVYLDKKAFSFILFYNKYLRCLLSIIIIAIIAAVCGFTMSIIRAGTMFVIMSFAPVFNRENDYLNSLEAALYYLDAYKHFPDDKEFMEYL